MNKEELVKLNLESLTAEEKINYAEEFSEGSSALKKLLLKMWDNGIETYACCAGHGERVVSYIFFSVEKFLNLNIKSFITKIIACAINYDFNFLFSNDYMYDIFFPRRGLSFASYSKECGGENFFMIIDEILFGGNDDKKCNLSKQHSEIVNSVIKLYEIDMLKYLSFSKKSSNCQISTISICLDNKELNLIRCYNNMKRKSIELCNRSGKKIRYMLAEGFYRKINGKYYTYKNNEFIELCENDLKNYKKYKIYKKYNHTTNFTVDKFNNILKIFK